MENKEDFQCYLQYNCLQDYLAFTTPNAKESTKTTIIARHQKGFTVWSKLINDWQLNVYFTNMRLPLELISGNITAEFFRDMVIQQLNTPERFNTAEMILLYAQYPENKCPSQIYGKDTKIELFEFKQKLENYGFNEENKEAIYHRKEKGLLFEAKMEAIGVKKDDAQKIMAKAETINIVEQLADLSVKYVKAKDRKEKTAAKKQLQAFVEMNKEFLDAHKEQLKEVNKIVRQARKEKRMEKRAKAQTETTESDVKTEVITTEPTTKNIETTPEVKETTEKSLSETESPFSHSVYDYLNDRMNKMVMTELKIKDKQLVHKKKHKKQTRKESPAHPKSVAIKSYSGDHEVIYNDVFTIEDPEYKSPKLADIIHITDDIADWTINYLRQRCAKDKEYADMMAEAMEKIEETCHYTSHAGRYAQHLEHTIAKTRNSILSRTTTNFSKFSRL